MHLAACPTCSRQYDVTHLAAGSRVRCACDQVFSVEARGPLPVQALKCGHCGGVVRPDDEACPYCGGELSALDRHGKTLCPACYTRLADDANHCHGCGIEIRPQALTPLPESGGCPRCQGVLQIRSIEVADVVECSQCGGLWLRPEVFDTLCRRAVHQPAPSATGGPAPTATPETNIGYIPCLGCGEPMTRRQFRHGQRASGVVIDLCKFHGVWLDHTEIGRIAAFVRTQGIAPTPIAGGGTTGVPRPTSSTRSGTGRGQARSGGFGLGDVLEVLGEALFGELI